MGTISEKLEYLDTTREKIKDSINLTGINILSNDTFRSYADKLKLGYIDILNNGTDTLYSNFPKVSGKGSNLSLTPTYEAPMEIDLYGDTLQQTYTGKNLLNPIPDVSSVNGVTVSYDSNTQEITLNGTCTANNSIVAFGESSSSSIYNDNTFQLLANTRLYLRLKYISGTSSGTYRLAVFNNNFGTGLQATTTGTGADVVNSNSWTYNVTLTKFRLRFESGTTFSNYKIKVYMSTTDDDYEPFVGRIASPNPYYLQDIDVITSRQEINVVGKNLLDISDITTTSYITNNGNVSITLNGTGTGGISFTLSKPFTLKANTTYTLSLNNTNSSYSNATFILRNGDTNIFQINYGQSSVSYTPTSDITINTLRIYAPTEITFDNFTFSIQLEQSSVATGYEEYTSNTYEVNLGTIELNKIGNYEDRIYKDNGKWYLEKNIGKYNINTSQITLKSDYTNVEYAVITKPEDYLGYNSYDQVEIKCSSATWMRTQTSGWDSSDNIYKITGNATKLNWWVGFTKGTGLTAIQNVLAESYIIYPLTTSTITEITNTELIEQLEELNNAKSMNEITYISSSSEYLPVVLSVSALKVE